MGVRRWAVQHCHARYVGNGSSEDPDMGGQHAVLSALRNWSNKPLDAELRAKHRTCA